MRTIGLGLATSGSDFALLADLGQAAEVGLGLVGLACVCELDMRTSWRQGMLGAHLAGSVQLCVALLGGSLVGLLPE